MPNITEPLPFPPPAAVLESPPISTEPLTAHEKMAAAVLLDRIAAARRALKTLDLPLWVLLAAEFHLVELLAELRVGNPFTVRLRLRFPPNLPEGV